MGHIRGPQETEGTPAHPKEQLVTRVGDSGLRGCVPCYTCDVSRGLLTPFPDFCVVQFSSVQSLGRLGCRGDITDDSADILFKSFLQEAFVSSSGTSGDVHSLTSPVQHFLCRPQRRPPLCGTLKKNRHCVHSNRVCTNQDPKVRSFTSEKNLMTPSQARRRRLPSGQNVPANRAITGQVHPIIRLSTLPLTFCFSNLALTFCFSNLIIIA